MTRAAQGGPPVPHLKRCRTMAKRKTAADNGDQTVQTGVPESDPLPDGIPQNVVITLPAPERQEPPPPPPVGPQPAPPAPVNGNGTRRPAASWKYPAAAGVTIEV